jgi:fatty acid desaturase
MVLTNGFFIGKMLLCPHRQTELWSEGAPEIRDYVLHNIASTTDFAHNAGAYESLLLYSGFNVHIIHHLFPTIDHNKLPACNKIFL